MDSGLLDQQMYNNYDINQSHKNHSKQKAYLDQTEDLNIGQSYYTL